MTKIIDVSEYQPNIDYAKVKAAGIGGAILRCGYTGWGSSHSLNADKRFEAHYAGFQAAGVPVGAYYYSTADTVDFAKKEAEFVQSLLKGKRFELPIYYDLENNERQGKLSKALLTEIADTFCSAMEDAGYFVGVYANTSWFTGKLDHAALSAKYTIWLADYRGSNANKTLKRDIWQYTSKGSVNGVSGNVSQQPLTAVSYTLKSGDSWWSIAAAQLGDGTRYAELAAYNGKKPADTIYAGQVLKLPVKTASAARTYTVKAGDSWWSIAASQLGDGARYAELAAYNGKKPTDTIYAGQAIKLPK